MPRLPSSTPTDAELEILRVLWERGALTTNQVVAALAPETEAE